jgi:hypothetical protein
MRAQDNIVVSGDKKGQVAVWDHEKVHERTLYASMHRALTNNLRFLCAASDAACASASSDGLLKARPLSASPLCVLYTCTPGTPWPSVCTTVTLGASSSTTFPRCCYWVKWSCLRGCLGVTLHDSYCHACGRCLTSRQASTARCST